MPSKGWKGTSSFLEELPIFHGLLEKRSSKGVILKENIKNKAQNEVDRTHRGYNGHGIIPAMQWLPKIMAERRLWRFNLGRQPGLQDSYRIRQHYSRGRDPIQKKQI